MKPKSNKIPRAANLSRIVNSVLDEMSRRGQFCPHVWRALCEHSQRLGMSMTTFMFRVFFYGYNMRHVKQDLQRRWMKVGESVLMDQLWKQLTAYAGFVLEVREPFGRRFHQEPPPPWMRG